MLGDYSTILITVGSLACVAAFGWFFESAHESTSHEDTALPVADKIQQQRAAIYMIAVAATMGATIVSILT